MDNPETLKTTKHKTQNKDKKKPPIKNYNKTIFLT